MESWSFLLYQFPEDIFLKPLYIFYIGAFLFFLQKMVPVSAFLHKKIKVYKIKFQLHKKKKTVSNIWNVCFQLLDCGQQRIINFEKRKQDIVEAYR